MSDIENGFEEGEIRTNNNNISKNNISHSKIKEVKENNSFNHLYSTQMEITKKSNHIINKYNLSSEANTSEVYVDCLVAEEKSCTPVNYFDINSLKTVIV